MTASNTITVLDNDIVCGRGRGFEIFPGNQTFRRIIYENATSYVGHLENRSEKSILIKLIASKISENNMRFVKRAKLGWSLLGENEVKLKVRVVQDIFNFNLVSKNFISTHLFPFRLATHFEMQPLYKENQTREITRERRRTGELRTLLAVMKTSMSDKSLSPFSPTLATLPMLALPRTKRPPMKTSSHCHSKRNRRSIYWPILLASHTTRPTRARTLWVLVGRFLAMTS